MVRNIFLGAETLAKKRGCSSNFTQPHNFESFTEVILINATTLMHKSTLSTNNSGNNHFGQKYQKQNILRTFKRL